MKDIEGDLFDEDIITAKTITGKKIKLWFYKYVLKNKRLKILFIKFSIKIY